MKGKIRKCVNVQALLDAFADNELWWWKRRQVAAHLKRCTSCAEELQSIRRLTGMLAAIPPAVPRRNLALQVRHALALRTMSVTAGTTVFILGLWTAWQIPCDPVNLLKTAKVKRILVSTDCYVANNRISGKEPDDEANSQLIDGKVR